MQINGRRRKLGTKQAARPQLDNDFALGFEDSGFEKFKPIIKVMLVIVLIASAAWGAVAYFGGTDSKSDANKNYTSNTARSDDDIDARLSECAADMNSKNPIPEADDNDFYPKLIAHYDAQIDCYSQYPEANGVSSRSSLEYQRDNALDSSGSYKSTYLSNSSPSSSRNTVTGCDYSLNESEYLKCTDSYFASSTSGSSSNEWDGDHNTPTTPGTPPSRTVDVEWCSSKSAEVSTLRSEYQTARGAVQAKQTEINNIPQTIRQRYANAGAVLTESQRVRYEAAERQKLNSEMTGLVAAQNDASSKYNAAQGEYNGRCY